MSSFRNFCGDSYSDSEESLDSDSREPFRSPSTPPNQTNYGLQFTGSKQRSSTRRRSHSADNTPPQSQSIRTPRSLRSSSENRRNIANDTSDEDTPSPRRSRPGPRSTGKQVPQARSREVDSSEEDTSPRRNRPGPSKPKSPRKQLPQQRPKEQKQNKRKQTKPSKSKPSKVVTEIYNLQHSTKLLIPKLPFSRLVREVLIDVSGCPDMRVTPDFLLAIQESAEMYLIQFFEDSFLCTSHRGRVTLIPKDMQLALRLRGINDLGSK